MVPEKRRHFVVSLLLSRPPRFGRACAVDGFEAHKLVDESTHKFVDADRRVFHGVPRGVHGPPEFSKVSLGLEKATPLYGLRVANRPNSIKPAGGCSLQGVD